MANITIPDEIKEKLAKLPKKVQDILINTETAATIGRIGLTHKLKIDKIGVLADETTLVILGVTHTKDFVSHLKERLEIDYEDAAKIAVDINEQIFAEIREELGGEGSGIKEGADATPQTPATKPTTDNQQLTTVTPGDTRIMNQELGIKEVVVPPKTEMPPFEQKLKEDAVFSAPAVVSEHEAPKSVISSQELEVRGGAGTEKSKPPLPTKAELKYGGQDPYKEPIE